MKKFLIASAFSMAALDAGAATVGMDADACSDNRFCYSVPNDAAVSDLTLYATASNGGIVELMFPDGMTYLGRGIVGLSIANYPVYRQPANDAVIYVSANWMTWTTKGGGSGRGGYATHTHWSLLGGSMITP
jgi:hypothetical protein